MNKHLIPFTCWLMEAAMIFGLFQAFERVPAAKAAPLTRTEAGVIAYVTSVNGREDQIRLINPNGSGDHPLWSTGDMGVESSLEFVNGLAWKPDGTELAFYGSHEAACSFYRSDIYAIRPDGTHYRRVVRPPACGQNPGIPTGTVEVTYYNGTGYMGPFFFFLEGAPAPQHAVIPLGDSVTITFNNVMDFGDRLQWATAIYGPDQFMSIEGKADVIPGGTVHTDVSMGYAYSFAYSNPTWNFNGSDIAYALGSGIYHMATNLTDPGADGSKLLESSLGSDYLAYGPTQATADKILYSGWSDGDNIFMATAGQAGPGELLVKDSLVSNGTGILGIAWLPDGSGFLFSLGGAFGHNGNLFRYDLASQEVTQLTNYEASSTHRMSISPDGTQVAYELQAGGILDVNSAPPDLYIMNIDDSEARLLVTGARSPAWGVPHQIVDNPVPVLTGINPSSVKAGGAGFTMTLSGSNLMDGSVVRWNGTDLPTTFVDASTLKAQVTAAQIAAPGTVMVTLVNPAPGGGVSAAFSFTINPDVQKIYLPLVIH